ncbi:MAG: hypothetical protein GXP30_06905 [Verrucomicrobia bacterium]|nr:hypothetical protein [Verrucomicrobiota bacterium]
MEKITKWAKIKQLSASMLVIAGMMSVSLAETTNLKKVFNDAKVAYAAQDYEKAAEGFRKVLKYQPGYIYARKYLNQAEAKIKSGVKPTVSLESKLAQLKISVEFSETDLGSVMTYLSQKSSEISGGKVVANFIYKGSSEDKTSKLVTLKLGNVPLTEVIRYVGQLTATKFKYEEFAIVGTPSATIIRQEAQLKAIEGQKSAETAKLKFDAPSKDPFKK